MDQYRIFIDIPMESSSQEEAVSLAHTILDKAIDEIHEDLINCGVKVVQIRVGNDLDRARRNYMDLNEEGHASTKKTKVKIV